MPEARSRIEAPDDLFEARHLSKTFPGVRALDDVSLRLRRGTVHALVGENGAGKSTLMKIIAGIVAPDAGELLLEGEPLRCRSPREALARGIAMIHQELNLMPFMTVAENIWIRREPLNALRLVRHGELRRRTRPLLERLRMDIDPQAQLRTLPIATRQLVEIARALSHEPKVLIMDEPTSALAEREAEHLFEIIRALTAQGASVFYITHRMEELFAIADDISVLRDGRHIASGRATEFTRDTLIHMMVGRELSGSFPGAPPPRSEPALAARALRRAGEFHDISFDLHVGEILGVAGLIGSGRSALACTLFGLTPPDSGTILIAGRETRIDSPAAAMAHGLALVTEDRKESGCFCGLSVL